MRESRRDLVERLGSKTPLADLVAALIDMTQPLIIQVWGSEEQCESGGVTDWRGLGVLKAGGGTAALPVSLWDLRSKGGLSQIRPFGDSALYRHQG